MGGEGDHEMKLDPNTEIIKNDTGKYDWLVWYFEDEEENAVSVFGQDTIDEALKEARLSFMEGDEPVFHKIERIEE